MYRLLTAKNFYQNSVPNIYLPSNYSLIASSVSDIKCSFCRKILLGQQNIEHLMLTRHQSTRMANAVKSLKKRGKHKSYKKYGELLEVNNQTMTETRVSISKLRGEHLSKFTSSPGSLGELHQIVKTKCKEVKNKEVDTELLQSVKNKILKNSIIVEVMSEDVALDDNGCALIYTNCQPSLIENKIKTKQFMDSVKESYYKFRKSTIYDQRLSDLKFAINEGVYQEFSLEPLAPAGNPELEEMKSFPRQPHAVFRKLFVDNDMDNYEWLSHLTSFQKQALDHPPLEEMFEDHEMNHSMSETGDIPVEVPNVTGQNSLNVKRARKALKDKKKAQRDKRRALAEANMKEELHTLELRGRSAALQRLLAAHCRLLCDLQQPLQARQVLQYYRRRSKKSHSYPAVTDPRIYNIVLHGFAAEGKTECVRELLADMCADGVPRGAQAYAAAFEVEERAAASHSRGADTDDVAHAALQAYAEEMTQQGISLNDLVDKCEFVRDQHETVLAAIRRLQPDFQPVYSPPPLDYTCPLLDGIRLQNEEARRGLLESPAAGLLDLEELRRRGREQMQIEETGELQVHNVAAEEHVTDSVRFYRQKLEELEERWRQVLKEAFLRNLSTLRSQSSASHSAVTLYPYLTVLPVEQFVELMMTEVRALVEGSETYSPTLRWLQRDLGARVSHRYQTEQARSDGSLDKLQRVYEEYCAWYLQRQGEPLNSRQAWQLIASQHREGPSLDVAREEWPLETRQGVGRFLYGIIINDLKLDVNMFKHNAKPRYMPAVYKVHRPWGRAVRLELKPAPAWARAAALAARSRLSLRAALLPLLAPPAPWRSPHHGPYRAAHAPLVRMGGAATRQQELLEGSAPGALFPVYDALNQLGAVPWRLSARVLDLQLQLFRAGGDADLDIPPPASRLDTARFKPADKGSEFKRRLAINRARAEMHSLWCDANYKLSLASHYRDEIFWLPHNLDFRGRVYACPPHLSQLGADRARALLRLAAPRPLGRGGLRWLLLHCVNLTGAVKQRTISQRLQYAESVVDKMIDSADNPLGGEQWWRRSDEPWQTLACCMEIADALRSPDHEAFLSGFPVHQDGSCNGLQHYAALGGDVAGAEAVNLAPLPAPRDVYSDVAALVEARRARDAAGGVAAAAALEGHVRRKVIKQTVMTTVYGVTRYGARLQIAKQLKDAAGFPTEQVWACSHYLTACTFDALREMFCSTRLIQEWFTDCAKVISGVYGEDVEWVTPLGLPVVQPYHRRDHSQRPCVTKQRNAFPPNYIHSLDSSHMMLTALRCEAAGVCFVSVHDCYWTHPGSVDTMNQICREQFVALHSRPLLQELSYSLVRRYAEGARGGGESGGAKETGNAGGVLRAVPPRGEFQIENVLRSVYFFS